MNCHMSSLPVEREDEESMVSNEEFFQRLVSGVAPQQVVI